MEPAALAVRELMDGFRYQADDVQDGEHGALARGQWDSMEQSVGLLPMDTGQPGNTDNTGYASDTGDSRNIGDMLDQWTRS